MNSIVITGATSMTGAALVRRAVAGDMNVLCIVRKGSTRLANIPASENVKIILADHDEYSSIDVNGSVNNSGNYDTFYHLAWDKASVAFRDDIDTQLANIQHTADAVRLAKRLGCKKFVGAGSQAEYGIVTKALEVSTPADPASGYGIAKYAAGKLSRLMCKQSGMQFNWARILSVYGPLDGAHTLAMYTISELLAGRPPEFTKCEQIWDYIYCDDAADALLAIGEKGVDGKAYPLGSGDRRRLSEYLESIRNIVAPNIALQFGKKDYYPHQPMYLCADISELTGDTGWKPRVSFEDGIGRTAAALGLAPED